LLPQAVNIIIAEMTARKVIKAFFILASP